MEQGERVVKLYNELKGQRSSFETQWQTLHDYYFIRDENVNKSYYDGTELDIQKLYDSHTLKARQVCVSGIHTYLTSAASKWFELRTKNPQVMESKDVKVWLEDVSAEVNYTLNTSNWDQQVDEFYASSVVYGTAIMFEEEDNFDRVRFQVVPIRNVQIVEDAAGHVVEYYIWHEYTAVQAVSKFGYKKVEENVRKTFDDSRNPDKKFGYIQFIGPRHARDVAKDDAANMPIQSVWVSEKTKQVVKKSGYREFPAFTHRFYKRPTVAWGFSPCMVALSDARVLNAMAKTTLRGAMKLADPAMIVPDKGFVLPLNFNPAAINYLKRNTDPNAVRPVQTGANMNVAVEFMNMKKQDISENLFNDVFMAFSQISKQMTVPEVQERITEKMTLLGPAVGRFISEFLDPMITRTVNILARNGYLPPVPDELANADYEIEYVSPLARAQRASELQTIQSTLAIIGGMAQFKPEVLDKINADKTADIVAGITGSPATMFFDDDEVAAIREQRAKAQQQAALMEQLQAGAQIAKTGSEAQKNVQEVSVG